MLTGVDYIRDVCKSNKISIASLEKNCGFSNGYLNPKKLKKVPYDRAVLIVNYFAQNHISVDINQILGIDSTDENSESHKLTARDERNIAKDLDDIMEKLTNKEDGPLNYNGIDLDDDTISLLSDAIGLGLRQIKIRNKEKYTPKKYKK